MYATACVRQVFACLAFCFFVLLSGKADAQTFTLSGVIFNESVYLEGEDLQATVDPYLNTPLTFGDVSAMIDDVAQLYVAMGVLTATVVLEPQEVAEGGVLALTLVEAVLEDISYQARSDFQEQLLENVFQEEVGDFPDFDRLAQQVRYFQVAYGQVPSIAFEAGQAPQTTRQAVSLEVERRADWSVSLDNHANDGEGRARLTLARNIFDLTGRLDSLAASVSLSSGGFSIAGTYRRPVASFGGMMSVAATISQKEVVDGPFAAARLATDTMEFSANYTQPFWVQADRFYQFQLGATLNRSNSTILGVPLQETSLSYLDARVSMARSYPRASLSADLALRFGSASSATLATTDGSFVILLANAAYSRVLSDRFSLLLSGRLQLAPDQNLPSSMRISAGGLGSLVGYPEDVRTGDSGFTGRIQLSCNAPCIGDPSSRIQNQLFAFIDFGQIEVFRGPNANLVDNPTLYSAGFGANFQIGNAIANFTLGVPFTETTGFRDAGTPRIYAGVTYRF